MGDDLPQHMQALARANEIRLQGAKIKRRIHNGEIAPERIFDVADAAHGALRVIEVLTAQRRWGPKRARRTISKAIGIFRYPERLEQTRLRDLTLRERMALAQAVVEASGGAGSRRR